MNSSSTLHRERRGSTRRRAALEPQASNEPHILWEGERAKRVLKSGPMQSTLEAKTVVFDQSGGSRSNAQSDTATDTTTDNRSSTTGDSDHFGRAYSSSGPPLRERKTGQQSILESTQSVDLSH